MANSDKNIVITPNVGLSGLPEVEFTGAGNSSVTLTIPDSSTGTLEFRSGIGTVFSVDGNTGGFTLPSRDNTNLDSMIIPQDGNIEIQANVTLNSQLTLPAIGSTYSGMVNPSGEEGQIYYDKILKTPMISNGKHWMTLTRPEIIQDPNTLLLNIDPQNYKCYYRDNIHQGWQDYQSNQSNYEILAHNSIKLKATSTGWIGRYYANIPSNGRWYLTYTAWSDSSGSELVVDNDGANDNTYNVTRTLYPWKQTFTQYYDTTETGTIYHYFRRNSGGNIYVSNVSYYRNNTMYNLASGRVGEAVERLALNNGVSYEEDDGALHFNGNYASFSTFNMGNGNSDYTFSIWVKTISGGHILSNSSGGPVTGIFGINNGKMWNYHYNGSWQSKIGNTYVQDGKWHQLTWVGYNDGNQSSDWYVDGVLDSSWTGVYYTNNNPLDRLAGSWSGYYYGAIGQFLVYQNRALTSSEVLRNFNATRWRYRV